MFVLADAASYCPIAVLVEPRNGVVHPVSVFGMIGHLDRASLRRHVGGVLEEFAVCVSHPFACCVVGFDVVPDSVGDHTEGIYLESVDVPDVDVVVGRVGDYDVFGSGEVEVEAFARHEHVAWRVISGGNHFGFGRRFDEHELYEQSTSADVLEPHHTCPVNVADLADVEQSVHDTGAVQVPGTHRRRERYAGHHGRRKTDPIHHFVHVIQSTGDVLCCIKSIPDEVQMAITDDGEVVG